jgi:hypothetical protein
MHKLLPIAVLLLVGCDKKPAPAPSAAPTPPDFAAKPATAPTPAPAPAPAQAPAPAGATWAEWTHPQKLMTAKFPRTPQQTDNEAPSPIGTVKFTMATHAEQTRAFMAGGLIYTLPEGTSFDVEKALDGARDQMLANINAKATSEKKIALDGFDGREIAFEAPGPGGATIRGVTRVFAGDRPPAAYVASAFRLTEGDDPDAVVFLDSVHINKGQ